MYGIAATSLSLLQQLCMVNNGIFLYGRCECLFVTDLTNKYFNRQIFYKRFLSGLVLHGNLLQFHLEHGHFWNIGILLGCSIAT